MKVSTLTDFFHHRNRSLLVDFLAILFGVGSWIGINGTYLQLPLFVQLAPEGWNLPSYMVVVIQVANIGPITYTLIQKIFPGRIKESYFIYCLLVTGSVTAILMALLHEKTSVVLGMQHSTALLSLLFFFALVGCTSSVLFMPYMGRYRDVYLVTYLVGEGLSGFLPSVIALIQGVGGNPTCVFDDKTNTTQAYTPPPRFTTTLFFLLIAVMLGLSAISFFMLNFLTVCKNERVSGISPNVSNSAKRYQADGESLSTGYENKATEPEIVNADDSSSQMSVLTGNLTKSRYIFLLVLMGTICLFANGVFPSIQSFSCLPYGNLAYHLTVTLSSMANPIACFLAVFLPHTSLRSIVSLSVVTGLVSCYVIACSLLSPEPPLVGQTIGEALVVVAWTVLIGLVSYVKLCITSVFRIEGGQSLFLCGAVSQLGSAVGAVVTFLLVNFTEMFKSYFPCQ